eukprot:8813209-Pyramimonas_sp.AAC.1
MHCICLLYFRGPSVGAIIQTTNDGQYAPKRGANAQTATAIGTLTSQIQYVPLRSAALKLTAA